MMPTEAFRPGRLNVLLGAMSVIVRASTSGESEAIGTCRCPLNRMSQWISYSQMVIPRRRQNSAMRDSSARVYTRPTGLCGLQSRNMRVRGWIARSNASQSTV